MIQQPLAMLRGSDPETWHRIHTLAHEAGIHTPGTDPLVQALAAALIGLDEQARQIILEG